TACLMLTESYHLDPLPGVLFTLAECEPAWGKIATVVEHYDQLLKDVAELLPSPRANHRQRERVAQSRPASLPPSIRQLVIVLPKGTSPDTIVRNDGQDLTPEALAAPLLVDPGQHLLFTVTPDGERREKIILIGRGEQMRVELAVAPARTAPAVVLPP